MVLCLSRVEGNKTVEEWLQDPSERLSLVEYHLENYSIHIP